MSLSQTIFHMILYNFDVYSFFPDFTDDFRIGSGVGDDQIDLIKAVDADETVAFELAVISQKNGFGRVGDHLLFQRNIVGIVSHDAFV